MGKSRRWPFWLAVPSLALGATAFWWYARGPEAVSAPRGDSRQDTLAALEKSADTRVAYVARLAQGKGTGSSKQLIDTYAKWAGDPKALEARKLILDALFDEASLGLRLQHVLQAVAADRTPPEEDPLWPRVVETLADGWKADAFDQGRTLMLMDTQPRARRALVESFSRLAQSDRMSAFSDAQRHELASDFIDVYREVDDSQKPDVEAALRALAGEDVVATITGRALDPNVKLQAEVEAEREVQQALRGLQGDPNDLDPPVNTIPEVGAPEDDEAAE